MIQCNKLFAKINLQGLIQIQDKSGCQIVTNDFSFTFEGATPTEMFFQLPPKIVEAPMPNVTLKHVNDDMDNAIEALSKSIDTFNETMPDLEPLPMLPVMNYIAIALTILALLLIFGLIIMFLIKSKAIHAGARIAQGLTENGNVKKEVKEEVEET